jgi:D-3-phosphoglycerate dehydrogenase
VKLLLASPISPDAIDHLRSLHDVVTAFDSTEPLSTLARDRQAIIVRSGVTLSADVLAAAPDLELIVRAGSGMDNIDLDHAAARSIRVVRVPGPSAQAVAELTFGLILTLSRKIALADALIRRGHWPKRQLGGYLMHGKVLGVIGAGRIGGRVAELGAVWGMRPIGCVKEGDLVATERLRARGIERGDFDTVVSEADVVSVHTPLADDTRGLIDAVVLGKMKPGSLLINTSRGGVVDEDALYDALRSGHLAGAALDVHEQEGEGVVPRLAEFDNVVMTPHIGGMALESQAIIGRRVIELIDAYVQGSLDDTLSADEFIL